MANDNGESEINKEERRATIKIPTPWGPWEIRGLGAILTLSLAAQVLIAYMLWDHMGKDIKTERQLSRALDNIAMAQREFACIISKDQSDRNDAFRTGECRRIARIGLGRENE